MRPSIYSSLLAAMSLALIIGCGESRQESKNSNFIRQTSRNLSGTYLNARGDLLSISPNGQVQFRRRFTTNRDGDLLTCIQTERGWLSSFSAEPPSAIYPLANFELRFKRSTPAGYELASSAAAKRISRPEILAICGELSGRPRRSRAVATNLNQFITQTETRDAEPRQAVGRVIHTKPPKRTVSQANRVDYGEVAIPIESVSAGVIRMAFAQNGSDLARLSDVFVSTNVHERDITNLALEALKGKTLRLRQSVILFGDQDQSLTFQSTGNCSAHVRRRIESILISPISNEQGVAQLTLNFDNRIPNQGESADSAECQTLNTLSRQVQQGVPLTLTLRGRDGLVIGSDESVLVFER